jgi:hypothetical protein
MQLVIHNTQQKKPSPQFPTTSRHYKIHKKFIPQKKNALENEVFHLQSHATDQEAVNSMNLQNLLENVFCIYGIPCTDKNDLKAIMANFLLKLGLSYDVTRDFRKLYLQKLGRTNKTFITVKVFNWVVKSTIFTAFKQKKPILTEDLLNLPEDSIHRRKEIYIHNKLTKYKRDILNELKKFKSFIKFIWEDEGRILIRTNDNAPVKEVQTIQEARNITHQITTSSVQQQNPIQPQRIRSGSSFQHDSPSHQNILLNNNFRATPVKSK